MKAKILTPALTLLSEIKNYLRSACLLLILLLGSATGWAQNTGDVCEDPLLISGLPYTTTGNTADFSNNYVPDDFPPLSENAIGSPGKFILTGNDVVYAYTPSQDETIDISITDHEQFTGFYVFTGCPFESTVGGLTIFPVSTELKIEQLPVLAGTTYYIVISSYYVQDAPYSLTVEEFGYDCAGLEADFGDPCNDLNPNTIFDVIGADCNCAGELPSVGMLCDLPIEVPYLPYITSDNTVNYGNNYGSADCPSDTPFYVDSDYLDGNEVVYAYTPLEDGAINISVADQEAGTGFFIFTGCPFESTAGGHTSFTNTSELRINELSVTAGTTYYIVVSTRPYYAIATSYTLIIEEVDCPLFQVNIGGDCDDGNMGTIDDEVSEDCTCVGVVPPNGTLCAVPIEITSLPFLTTDNTELYGDNHDPSEVPELADNAIGNPDAGFLNGRDITYSYTPAEDGLINISITDQGTWTGLFVFTGCPFTSTLGGATPINTFIQPLEVELLPVQAGVTYYIVVSSDNYITTHFTLEVTEVIVDCLYLAANFNDTCDDGNPNTILDYVHDDCTCSGYIQIPGILCEEPIEISSLPYLTSDNTINYGNAYEALDDPAIFDNLESTPPAYYLYGNEVVYAYTPSEDGNISITVSDHDINTGFFIFTGCPFETTVGGKGSYSGSTDLTVESLPVSAGITYYIVISTHPDPIPLSTPYTLSITGYSYDCPDLEVDFGTDCNDGDPNTLNDKITADCECIGTTIIDGMICEVPIVVSSLPYLTNDSTDLYEDKYETSDLPFDANNYGTLGPLFINGNEVVYAYVPSEDSYIDISVTSHWGRTGFFVMSGCPFETILGGNTPPASVTFLEYNTVPVLAGITYYIVISSYTSQTTTFTLSIAESVFDCPNLFANIGEICDDIDPNTYNDVINEDCECAGIPYDCIQLLADIGDPCDDGNTNTVNDIITEDCLCSGSSPIDGMICEAPINITAIPYSTTDNTELYGDNYEPSDLTNLPIGSFPLFINGNEVVYAYTPSENNVIDINISEHGSWAGFFIYTGCPFETYIDSRTHGNAGTPLNIESLTVLSGVTYYIIISSYVSQSTAYTLNITQSVLDCPDLLANFGDICEDNNSYTTNDIVHEDCTCAGDYPPNGNICQAPIEVSSLPYLTTDNTINYGDNYESSDYPPLAAEAIGNPESSYLNGYDVIYAYTPIADISIDLSVTEHAGGTGLFVFTGCAFESTVGGHTHSSASVELIVEDLLLDAGTTYYIVISNYTSQSTPYTLRIAESEVDCPDLQANFGEPCNDFDPATTDDEIQENCTCLGAPINDGIICEAPIQIGALPYLTIENTINFEDTYEPIDLPAFIDGAIGNPIPNFLEGNDAVYAYTAPQDGAIDIIVTDHGQFTGFFIFDGCPFENTLGGSMGFSTSAQLEVEELPVLAGVTYYIVVSSYSSQTTAFTLNIVEFGYDCITLSADIGDACDDGNPESENDVITADCECAGVIDYECDNLQANIGDACNDGNPATENDVVGYDCFCAGTSIYDCVVLEANIGDACDDGDDYTYNDVIDEDCICAGIFSPDPVGLVCEAPITILSLPYSTTDNTGNYGDDYYQLDIPSYIEGAIGQPNAAYLTGDDVVYAYSPAQNGAINISVTEHESNTGFFVFTGCPFESALGGHGAQFASVELTVNELPVLAGVTYYIVISTNANPYDTPIRQTTEYTLTITEFAYDCPDLGADFGTPCDDANPNTLNDQILQDCSCGELTGVACEAPIEISTLPYLTTDNTTLYGDDYDMADVPPFTPEVIDYVSPFYLRGNDVVYAYTPSETGAINISVTNHDVRTGLYVFTGCPFEVTVAGETTTSANVDLVENDFQVLAGTTYYIVISTSTPTQTTSYTLSVTNASLDCPILSANIGDVCDDGDANTENDLVTANCECVGTVFYDCADLEANIGDACDDGNPDTENTVISSNCECALPAAINDICDSATVISCDESVQGTTVNANEEGDEGNTLYSECKDGEALDVFYSLEITAGFIYTITAVGADYDAVLAVYHGPCVDLFEVDCANEAGTGEPESITFTAYGDQNMTIRTFDANGSQGSFTLSATCGFPVDCPVLNANIGDACDDGNPITENDEVTETCECIGEIDYECPALEANIWDSCDDGNPATENDVINESCECIGTIIYDCPELEANIGESCNDGNPITENDVVNESCECLGVIDYECPALEANIWDSCNDGNPATENDVVNESCECIGTIIYDCVELEANIGESCDDGNPITENDVVTEACECLGVIDYECPALEANIWDSCDDGNPATENDVINEACECIGTIIYDCEALEANIGDSCDDGNAGTENDMITAGCECEGTVVYDCQDVMANIGDACDDGNAATENDMVTEDCGCSGVPTLAGMICEAPIVVTELPYLTTDNTELYGNNYDSSDRPGFASGSNGYPSATYLFGNDVVYAYTPSLNGTVNITVTGHQEGSTGLYVFTGCPFEYTVGGQTYTDYPEVLSVHQLTVLTGITYYIVISTDGSPQTTPYTLLIKEFDCINLGGDVGEACSDDDPNTFNDTITEDCECIGEPPAVGSNCEDAIPVVCNAEPAMYETYTANGVNTTECEMGNNGLWFTFEGTGANIQINLAVNFDEELSVNFGSCESLTNLVCVDEGNSPVTDETYIIESSVAGEIYYLYIAHHSPSAGQSTTGRIYIDIDCAEVDCPLLSANIGDPCNDGNNQTENDVVTNDCECSGTIVYDCPALEANVGESCDDNNPETMNDVVTADCGCEGTIVYDCPALSANIGALCDDGDPTTINDEVTIDCECVGTSIYDCPALEANIGESCDDNNPETMNDVVTADCGCEGTIVYDCPTLSANIGALCDDGDPTTINDEVTIDCECVGTSIYDCPALEANVGESCDDNNPETMNDVVTADCGCEGTIVYDCPALSANIGALCDDGDPTTINDEVTIDCECVGTSIYDCPALEANIGESCDDNNPETMNDVVTADCGCEGTIVYDCPTLAANIGALCDDGDPTTINDEVTIDCECVGTSIYDCPALEANIGESCDDNNPETMNDVVTADCGCEGTIVYDCPTLAANIGALCDDGDPTTINDEVTIDCECVGTSIYDCPALEANIGENCDDNNPETMNDVVTADCGCEGSIMYDCPALEANVGDACDDGNAGTENDIITADCGCQGTIIYDCPALEANIGEACDDGNAGTENDMITADCGCQGTIIYDCPALAANIGDACDDGNAGTENDMITADCGCEGELIPPVGCTEFVYYLSDYIDGQGTTIYRVTLNGVSADMEYLAQIEPEVQLAYSNEHNLLYAVSKLNNRYYTLNPHSENPVFSAPVILAGNLGQITGAAFAANGDLLISNQSRNVIYSIDIMDNSVSLFDSYAPIRGGDIATDLDGNVFLNSNGLNGNAQLYEVVPESIASDVFVSNIDGNNTGLAITDSNELLYTAKDNTYLGLIALDGTSIGQYQLRLNGSLFELEYGDMASGCNTYQAPEPQACETFRTFYANKMPELNATTLYEVHFEGSMANLTELTSVEDEVHIGYNPSTNIIYMVSKTEKYVRQYDLIAETMSPKVFFSQTLFSITGADFNPSDELLYIADANTSMIYTLDPATGEITDFTNADVHGGDITNSSSGTAYLATQSGNRLYAISPDLSSTFIGGIPSSVTGLALSENVDALIMSNYNSKVFIEINTTNATTINAYKAVLDGSPFTLKYGDMASGCVNTEIGNTNAKTFNVNEQNQHLTSQKSKTTLTSHPNPTTGASEVVFVSAHSGYTFVKVYDMTGRNIATLFDQEAQEGSTYRIDFDGEDLPNGVYIYRLTNQNETVIEKFIISK